MSVEPLIKISEHGLVCLEFTELVGDILIGSKTVIHPTAKILAKKGKIIIGECNLIEEYVTIINESEEPLVIGSQNLFEVGCYVESASIGNNNVFEAKCRVAAHCLVSNNCTIGARCIMNTEETLPNNTVIYGPHCKRRIHKEKPHTPIHQIDFLSKIMPNYEKIVKPNWNPVTNSYL